MFIARSLLTAYSLSSSSFPVNFRRTLWLCVDPHSSLLNHRGAFTNTKRGLDTTTAKMSSSPDSPKEEGVKATAFGICFIRCLLSMLPPEAGALCYDEKTTDFEGIALDFNPARDEKGFGPGSKFTLMAAAKAAKDFGGYLQEMSGHFPPEKNWRGFDFNFCRAHFVDNLLLKTMTDESCPIRQVVFCGIGQDYRGMRHGKVIASHGAKVFELDLAPMMECRKRVKEEICEMHPVLAESLPETHELVIDFDKQSISQVLVACPAFDPATPTLYIWEGVSYYLTPPARRSFFTDILGLVNKSTPDQRKHHRIFFDHLIDLPHLVADPDHVDVPAKAMLDMFANSEPLLSFLDFDQVEPYLKELGFCIQEQLLPPDMYKPYQVADNEIYRLKESKYFGMVVARPVE